MIPQVTLAMALCAAPLAVNGATFFEDFEAYTPGSDLHGQGGWKGWDNNSGAGALASNAYAFSGTTSVAIAGGSDLVHEFTGVTSGQWTFSTMMYIPTAATGETWLILLNTYNDGGPQNWSLQTTFNLATDTLASQYIEGATLPVVRNAWVPFRAEIDLDANTVSEYYNNQLLGSHAWMADGALAVQAVDLYANNAGAVYYDNVSLIPESSSIALAAAGAMGLFLRRRRARA